MKTKILKATFIVLLLASCKVSWVPDYDATLEQQITDAAKANDEIYLNMLAVDTSRRTYANFAQAYVELEADINAIKLKVEASKHPKDMDTLVSLVHRHFAEYRDEHRNAKKPLNDAQLHDYEIYMQAFWLPLLKAEQGLPHTVPNQ